MMKWMPKSDFPVTEREHIRERIGTKRWRKVVYRFAMPCDSHCSLSDLQCDFCVGKPLFWFMVLLTNDLLAVRWLVFHFFYVWWLKFICFLDSLKDARKLIRVLKISRLIYGLTRAKSPTCVNFLAVPRLSVTPQIAPNIRTEPTRMRLAAIHIFQFLIVVCAMRCRII